MVSAISEIPDKPYVYCNVAPWFSSCSTMRPDSWTYPCLNVFNYCSSVFIDNHENCINSGVSYISFII